jgi:hypothetical protein
MMVKLPTNIAGAVIMLIRAIINTVLVFLMLSGIAYAEDGESQGQTNVLIDSQVKELSGISIIGSKEAPKSLYIVPWQNSEVGVATGLRSGLLDDSMRPLDKEVFLRELDFYELSHSKNEQ